MCGRWLLALFGAVAPLRCGALADDWVAWRGSAELGPPDENRGWAPLPDSARYVRMGWEVPGGANGYRYHHPHATHYTLGTGRRRIEIWQPFPDNILDGVVCANIRAALYTLYHNRLAEVEVKVVNSDWGTVADAEICRGDRPCPNVIVLSYEQVPGRVNTKSALRLDDLLASNGRLQDDFPQLASYQYQLERTWWALPLMLDFRLLQFNRTTLEAMGEELPPPHGRRASWSWADFADLACKISRVHGKGAGLRATSGWNDDFELAMLMAQSSGRRLLEDGKCGLRGGVFAESVRLWKRLIREECIGVRTPGGEGAAYWSGVSPPIGDFNRTLAPSIDASDPPPQAQFSLYDLNGVNEGPGFFFTRGVNLPPQTGRHVSWAASSQACTGRGAHSRFCYDIMDADMPGQYTTLAGTGLILPACAGDMNSASPCRAATDADEQVRIEEGWRIMTELTSRAKPWLVQMNTMGSIKSLPPAVSLISKPPFTEEFWQPAVRALRRAIPPLHPANPLEASLDIETVKPVRIALIRGVYGNFSAERAIDDGCDVFDELVRPCNQSRWETDPRCRNLMTGGQGCGPGRFMAEGARVPDGNTCELCGPGFFKRGRGVRCLPCEAGEYSDDEGATACKRCASSGAVGAQVCDECDPESYSTGSGCKKCPPGTTPTRSLSQPGQCDVTPLFWVQRALLILLSAALVFHLQRTLFHAIPVGDVRLESGCLVVSTCVPHKILERPWGPVRVRLDGTGHFLLDGLSFRAVFRSATSLELLTDDGEALRKRADTSMGQLQVSVPHSFFCAGERWWPTIVPLAASSVLLSWLICSDVGSGATWAWQWYVASAVGAVVVAALLRYQQVVRFRAAPIERRRTSFSAKLTQANISPQESEPGPGRALSMGQIADLYEYFQDFIVDRDMHYVANNLIKPLTRDCKKSYAELIGPKTVEWFVSHYWGQEFREFTSSLRKHAEHEGQGRAGGWRDVNFWVCSLSNNQWNLDADVGFDDPLESSFYKALTSPHCKGTAMVIDQNAWPLTRSWCLFEVFQTCKLTRRRTDFAGLLLCMPTGVLQRGGSGVDAAVEVARRLSTLSLKDAAATRPRDKEMIDHCVEGLPGGFDSMNGFVRGCIKEALIVAHTSFERDFRDLVTVLDALPDGGDAAGPPSPGLSGEGGAGSEGDSNSEAVDAVEGDAVADSEGDTLPGAEGEGARLPRPVLLGRTHGPGAAAAGVPACADAAPGSSGSTARSTAPGSALSSGAGGGGSDHSDSFP